MSFIFRSLFLSLLVVAACTPALAKPGTGPAITVFAAASLKESLDQVAVAWTRRSGQRVLVSFAASSALAHQIEQGAPADVFISADAEWMDYLQSRKLVAPDTRFNLLANRLVLVAPTAASPGPVDLSRPEQFLAAMRDGRLALAETTSVPAGRYARQALGRLRLWDLVAARLARGENVRAAMAFVARGEAPLGIVYATDALAEPRVRVVARFPPSTHDRIIYPAARVSATRTRGVGAFLGFLRSSDATAIFRKAGFAEP